MKFRLTACLALTVAFACVARPASAQVKGHATGGSTVHTGGVTPHAGGSTPTADQRAMEHQQRAMEKQQQSAMKAQQKQNEQMLKAQQQQAAKMEHEQARQLQQQQKMANQPHVGAGQPHNPSGAQNLKLGLQPGAAGSGAPHQSQTAGAAAAQPGGTAASARSAAQAHEHLDKYHKWIAEEEKAGRLKALRRFQNAEAFDLWVREQRVLRARKLAYDAQYDAYLRYEESIASERRHLAHLERMRRFRTYLAQKRAEQAHEAWFKREMRQEQLEAWAAQQQSAKLAGQSYDTLYDHYLKFQGR